MWSSGNPGEKSSGENFDHNDPLSKAYAQLERLINPRED